MKLKDFQLAQAQKAGINIEENKAYFDALPDIEVPETVVTGIDSALISIADAKNNHSDIKAHYFAQVLNPVDSIIEEAMKNEGFADKDRADVKNERSTYRRMEKMLEKINGLADTKIKNASPGSKAHQEEIDKLQNQLRTAKDQYDLALNQHKSELENIRIGNKSNSLWAKGAMPTIFDSLADDVRGSSLKNAGEIELKKAGLVMAIDENDNLVLRKTDGSTYYGADNRIVSPKAFFEKAFSESKIIVPNLGGNGATGNGQPAPTSIPAAVPNGGKIDINTGAAAHNKRALELAEKSMQSHGTATGML